MTGPSEPPTNDRFPELVFAYIGPNHAHREFRAAITNAKALTFILGKSNAAVLQSFLAEAREAKTKSRDGHYALGMAGARSTTTSVQLAVHLTGNEIGLIEAEPGDFVAQVFGLIYREVYRIFETFLVDLFAEIASKDKRVLYSSHKLTHEEALRADSQAVLLEIILEHRKSDLTRGGFLHLEQAFEGLGLPLLGLPPLDSERESARRRILLLSAARNLIEHNRSVVNDEFLTLVSDSPYTKGQHIIITPTELGDALSAVEWTADGLNRRAVDKFGLAA